VKGIQIAPVELGSATSTDVAVIGKSITWSRWCHYSDVIVQGVNDERSGELI